MTERIERVEPGGVRTADGRLHELDVLVLATGFHADAFMRPMDVAGRDGRDPRRGVGRPRPSAYLSISIPDFPNLFMLNGPNGPGRQLLAHRGRRAAVRRTSCSSSSSCASGECRGDQHDPRPRPSSFEADRVEAAQNTIWVTGCRSWYLDDRGVPAVWPWSFDRFREEMAAPDLAAYELRPR